MSEPEANNPAQNPVVTRIKSGDVPEAARLNAAKGLLPIPAQDLVDVMVFLSEDSSEEIRSAAQSSLAEFPEDQLQPILASEDAPHEVLAFFARNPRTETLSQALLLNPGTPDEAVETLAEKLTLPLLEILIKNEVRLIRHPPILKGILANPQVSPAIRRRCEEIQRDFIDKMAAAAAEAAETEAAEAEPATEAVVEAVAPAVKEEGAPDLEAPPSEALQEVLSEEASMEEGASNKKLTLEQKIMKLTTPEKIKLAYMGGRQARLILIRDPNKIISNSVMDGGKMSQAEAELVVQLRNIDVDILRRIATTKQFAKAYTIVHHLVKNPRTPIGVAMPLLSRLQMADLKRLVNNNNVSGAIRAQAKSMIRSSRR